MRAFFLDLGGNCSASSAVKVFDMKILFKGEGKKKIPLTVGRKREMNRWSKSHFLRQNPPHGVS